MSLAHVVAYANFLTKVLKVEIWCRGTADYMRLQRELLPVIEKDGYIAKQRFMVSRIQKGGWNPKARA